MRIRNATRFAGALLVFMIGLSVTTPALAQPSDPIPLSQEQVGSTADDFIQICGGVGGGPLVDLDVWYFFLPLETQGAFSELTLFFRTPDGQDLGPIIIPGSDGAIIPGTQQAFVRVPAGSQIVSGSAEVTGDPVNEFAVNGACVAIQPFYRPLTPARILDTRSGIGAPAAAVPAGGSLTLQVTGRGGVPASGVSAAVLNVTVTQPTGTGFITVFPAGASRPNTSNLNFVAGQTIPNLTTVQTGTGGAVTLFNGSSGTVHLIADVAGFYVGPVDSFPCCSGQFTPLTPARILDTRSGIGAPAAAVPAGGSLRLQVVGRGGVDSVVDCTFAAVLNVTVTQPTRSGFITIFPFGSDRPDTSNLNFVAGQTIPNLTVDETGDGGGVTLYNGSSGTVHLIADVSGWYFKECIA